MINASNSFGSTMIYMVFIVGGGLQWNVSSVFLDFAVILYLSINHLSQVILALYIESYFSYLTTR
jgi:hypothetical protein